MHPGDKDGKKKKKGPRWWHYHAAVKDMRSLDNSYYTQGQGGRLYWMGEHKPKHDWKVRVTGLTLSLASCLHPPKLQLFERVQPGKTANVANENSNRFSRGILTRGATLILRYPGRDEEITAAFVSKWEPCPSTDALAVYPLAEGAGLKGSISSLREPFTETLNSAVKGENGRKWLRGGGEMASEGGEICGMHWRAAVQWGDGGGNEKATLQPRL